MLKPGTVCVGQNFMLDTHRNGAECVVVRHLLPVGAVYNSRLTNGSKRSTSGLYEVEWFDGYRGPMPAVSVPCCEGHHLRPKYPPADTATTGERSILKLFKETSGVV